VCGRHKSELAEEAGLFEATIGDSPVGVVVTDESRLNTVRERVAPYVALPGVVEVHSTHASFSGAGGADERGFLRDNFGKIGGSGADTGSERSEGVEVEAHALGDADSVTFGVGESNLEHAEQATRAWDG